MKLFPTIALLTSGLHLTTAFRSLSIPPIVNANQTIQLTISNDLSSPSSFDGQFTNFRIYLALTAPSSSNVPNPLQPSCSLLNSSSILTSSTPINLTIPPSIGPDGTAYRICTLEYSTQTPHPPPPSSYEYSPLFTLYNTTSSWSPADLDAAFPPFPDLLPCDAYDCARQCLAADFPQNVNGTGDGFRGTYECMAACPGVKYPSWETVQRIGAARGQPLEGLGNQGGEVVGVGYGRVLGRVKVLPTPTRNGTNVTGTARPTATETKSEGGRRAVGWVVMGMVGVLGVLVM